ncbi:MAG TPA: hypothetical protein VF272_00140 [Candidatus Saccharimonadia bacterium]
MVLKLYTVFVALLLSLLVGVGVSAFYPAPKAPDYPIMLDGQTKPAVDSAEHETTRLAYEKQQKEFQKNNSEYNRNVSLITLTAAVLLLAIGLTLFRATVLMADGLTLGAVFTLIYSIIRGFGTDDTQFRFLMVLCGLAVALLLGYIKFVKPATAGKPASPKK